MRGRKQRNDTGIDDAKALNAVDSELLINDTAVAAATKLARAGGMEQSGCTVTDELFNVTVTCDVGSWHNLEGVQGLD